MVNRLPSCRRLCALAVLIALLLPALTLAYETERVVLVIIDGLRYSEGLGDPDHTYVPHMAAFADQGAIVDDFRNDGATYTSRAIPAIWCGAWTEIYSFNDPECDGYNNNYTELPTVFEYYRKHLSRPADDCIYVLKDLCPWRASFDVDYGPDYWPLYHTEGYSDQEVWQETQQVITTQSPSFMLMYLADVDHAGHSGDWDEYVETITIADSIVGQLWSTLQADPAYTGKTTMLVTNDHGRHQWDFSGHGDGCDGCRHIQLLAIGPDVRPGLVSDTPRVIPDIAPTIGELLGFATEQATGSPMTELFFEEIGIESELPPLVELTAYPNPFNPATTLAFTLPTAGSVELRVYDQAGREIRTLLRGFQAAGMVRAVWNGQDDRGRAVSSGTYLARLKTDAGKHTGKLVLVR